MEKQRKQNPDEANILLRIHKDLKSDLEKSAKENGRSINSELIQAVKAWLMPCEIKVNVKDTSKSTRV